MSLKKLTPTKLDKDQPWKVWAFVLGLNFVGWVGWYFMHDAPSKWWISDALAFKKSSFDLECRRWALYCTWLGALSDELRVEKVWTEFEQDLGIPSNPLVSMTYNCSLASRKCQSYQGIWAKMLASILLVWNCGWIELQRAMPIASIVAQSADHWHLIF